MLPAFLTTLLFSVSAVAGSRLTRLVGGTEANFWRILLAAFLLGIYAHTFGWGFSGKALPYLLLSGMIGFGMGDLALYQAYPILGSRICMILVHCLAAPLAAGLEWVWLGAALTAFQAACSLLILVGVAVALAPREHIHIPRKLLLLGLGYGLVAALGQGVGSVVSRKAYLVAAQFGEHIDGISAAYQRIWGGIAIAAASYFISRMRNSDSTGQKPFTIRFKQGFPWLVLNAVAGPALGVSCFQWALATTPTGIVLPIVALTPLTIIPFSRHLEGERPSLRSLLGGAIAVLGVVGLRFSLH